MTGPSGMGRDESSLLKIAAPVTKDLAFKGQRLFGRDVESTSFLPSADRCH